ncbi:MAG: hypothetical protein ACTHOG_01250 [Marmoricola sp.]
MQGNGSESQPTDPDTTSDPARSAHEGHDWTSEGGATQEGPATDVDDDDDAEPAASGPEDD